MKTRIRLLLLFLVLLAAPLAAGAAQPAGETLVNALRRGGYILAFRHAPTDWSRDDRIAAEGDWWSCDASKMRQLSAEGREAARRVGEAMRRLAIPVAAVFSSEYCRARETAAYFDLGKVTPSRDIMNIRAAPFLGGREAVIARARRALTVKPEPGTNIVWVAHGNVLQAATGHYPEEAGSIILAPGQDGPLVVGELRAEQWMELAASGR